MCTPNDDHILTFSCAAVFVADILGFSRLVEQAVNPHQVQNPLLRFQLLSHQQISPNQAVHGFALSDSIIYWVDLAVPGSFEQLIQCLTYLLLQSFASQPSILVRSGLATGPLSVSAFALGTSRYNSSVFYGRSYLEAYTLSNTQGLGVRCLLSDCAAAMLRQSHLALVGEFSGQHQYLWPAEATNGASHGYAQALLDNIGQMQPQPMGNALTNLADSLAFLLGFTDDHTAAQTVRDWARRNGISHEPLETAIAQVLGRG